MVKLYALYINDLKDPKEYPAMLEKLPEERKEKILRCCQMQARKQSLGAGLLLAHVLSLYGKKQEDITHNAYGKPEISDIYFNLSHSENLVICAVSDKPVGCDVEKMKGYPEGIAERFFSQQETAYLNRFSGKEKEENFYQFWTLKESYVKMIGKGIHLSFDRFEIVLDGNAKHGMNVIQEGSICDCYLKEFSVQDYKIAVCAKESEFMSEIQYMKIK